MQEHTLDNGLRLFILPRPGVPIASFVVQYRIGGVNERPGNTGIAHFLEHLLFKGTTSVGTLDYEKEAPLLAEMDQVFDSILVLEDQASPDSAHPLRPESPDRGAGGSSRALCQPERVR